MTIEEPSEKLDKDVLLVEYQKSQDSAQHHASMSWTATSIIWASSLVLLGFVYSSIDKNNLSLLLTFICSLGIALSISVNLIDIKLDKVVKQKYKRCKDIEDELGMRQHRDHVPGCASMRSFYNGITLLFVIMWSTTLWFIWGANP